ncbi:MAG: SGNH/GDSL hydrolase family protein [Pirellulaceae bacterium]
MRGILCAVLMTLAAVATAEQNPSAAYIQRTMKLLEASTAENPAHVRVMFYGQSITAQAWTQLLQQQLAQRYPTAQFEFRNAAIGGYDSSVLIRTADHDLYPWYPDLLFFHVYGPMDKYEEIVKRVRERTSAEIVIWTSHLNIVSPDRPTEVDTAHDERAVKIRAVAPKYHCMLIDLREKWRKHLADHGLAAIDLLSDTIHLNPQGCELHFQVQGSLTGADGAGWSTERFVSRSQRVVIEPPDWRIAWTLGYRKATLPAEFQVTWRSYPMFTCVYEPQPAGTRTLLVQGCANQTHTLTLIPAGGALGIGQFVVHAPAAVSK